MGSGLPMGSDLPMGSGLPMGSDLPIGGLQENGSLEPPSSPGQELTLDFIPLSAVRSEGKREETISESGQSEIKKRKKKVPPKEVTKPGVIAMIAKLNAHNVKKGKRTIMDRLKRMAENGEEVTESDPLLNQPLREGKGHWIRKRVSIERYQTHYQ